MEALEALEGWEKKDLLKLIGYIDEYYLQPNEMCLEEVIREYTRSDDEE